MTMVSSGREDTPGTDAEQSPKRDFYVFWVSETVSDILAKVTVLALPLIAISQLHATPVQVGLLSGANLLPLLIVMPFVGVFVDRYRRRPTLVSTNLLRAGLLATVPLLGWSDKLSAWYILVVAVALGVLAAVFNIACLAYIPTLVERDRLLWANGLLTASTSVAEAVGPALAGLLIEWMTPSGAMIFDALGMLAAALLVLTIRRGEPSPVGAASGTGVRVILRDVWSGLRQTLADPVLGTLAGFGAWANFFYQVVMTNFLLYAAVSLDLSPGVIGSILTPLGVGAALGGLLASKVGERMKLGPAMGIGMVVSACGPLLLMMNAGNDLSGKLSMGGGFGLYGLGVAFYNVYSVSLRQMTAAPSAIGRVSASYRVVAHGSLPLGAAAGGALGGALGFDVAILLSGAAMLTAALLYWLTPPSRLVAAPESPTIL